MLRRVNTSVAARAHAMAYHTTRHLLSNNKSHSSEDQAELERERALREKFAQKIGGFTNAFNNAANAAAGNKSGSTGGGSSSSSNSSDNTFGNNTLPPGGGFMRIFFFVSSIYLLALIMQLENPNSAISMFQGMRWWMVPSDTVAYLAPMRTVLPFKEQRRLQTEFEEAQKRDPNLTLAFFFQQRYPTMFNGNRSSQPQIAAAVAACLASSRDIGIIASMQRAAGMARDPRVAVDNIMDALYKEHPHVFAPAQ